MRNQEKKQQNNYKIKKTMNNGFTLYPSNKN